MRFADETGTRTWEQMGHGYDAATRHVPGVGFVDAQGFQTQADADAWKAVLAEEATAKAHAEFLASASPKPEAVAS